MESTISSSLTDEGGLSNRTKCIRVGLSIFVKLFATIFWSRGTCRKWISQDRLSIPYMSRSSNILLSAAHPTKIVSTNKLLSNSISTLQYPLFHAKWTLQVLLVWSKLIYQKANSQLLTYLCSVMLTYPFGCPFDPISVRLEYFLAESHRTDPFGF